MSKHIKCMKELDLFQGLEEREKLKVVQLAKGKRYPKGETVFREGEPADAIHLICSGQVLLYKVSSDGKEISLDILREGSVLGENTIFDSMHYTFSAKALSETFICRCFKDDLPGLLKNPDISLKIIKSLTDKLNSYTESLANIAFFDVKNRVYNTLLRIGKRHGENTPEGIRLEILLSHEDIAHLVNASRVMVTNTIISLKKEGKILTDNRYFIVREEYLAGGRLAKR